MSFQLAKALICFATFPAPQFVQRMLFSVLSHLQLTLKLGRANDTFKSVVVIFFQRLRATVDPVSFEL